MTQLPDALAAASSGTTVALGKGTYDDAVELPTGVTIHGTCVAETVVACSELILEDVVVRGTTAQRF